MFYDFQQIMKLPEPFAPDNINFWDDAYISQKLLEAHLDPDYEGASRKTAFINRSVAWICAQTPADRYPAMLDLGCGPGLYAERLSGNGYHITGIDFSKRSIAYAKERAAGEGIPVSYHCQNYLEMNIREAFDIAIMIYCDYGALSPGNRGKLLHRVWQSLKPGGLFLFDVFTLCQYHGFSEEQTWAHHKNGGFWREDEYIEVKNNRKYQGHISLEKTTVLSPEASQVYHIWNQYFTVENLVAEVERAGFINSRIFADVSGNAYTPESKTIAIWVQKP